MKTFDKLESHSDNDGILVEYKGDKSPSVCKVIFHEYGVLRIDKNATFRKLYVEFFGKGGQVNIGAVKDVDLRIVLGEECTINIGNSVTTTNTVYMTAFEKTTIAIGDDCMFSTGNELRTDDAHPIFDVTTGERINFASDIVIGDHVWLGVNTKILGGSIIGTGSITGMGSIVKGLVPNNSIAAGIPAKVIRKDIAWERPHLRNRFVNNVYTDEGLIAKPNKKYWNKTKE